MSDTQNTIIPLVVPAENQGLRLDRYIAAEADQLSRQRVKALLAAGRVTLDGSVCTDASRKLKGGERVEIDLPPSEPTTVIGEHIPLTVVYEDDALIVIDKPAGLVTHPAPGHPAGTLVNALVAHLGDRLSGVGGVKRPGIVHRLDKDTSGLLVVAKTDAAHHGLADQFAAHGADGRLERSYLAIVWGRPERPKGRIAAALGRSSTNRRKIAIVPEDAGRHAVTHYRVEKTYSVDDAPVASRLRIHLETGRTHQIRVHMASVGHPLLGDKTYGSGFKASALRLSEPARAALTELDRQALHAATLAFEHPLSAEHMRFESPLPPDMARLDDALAGTAP